MGNILRNWSMMRILRVALGGFVLAEGIGGMNALSMVLGGLLLATGIFNVGCCGTSGCGVDYRANSSGKNEIKDITYEELAGKK